MVCKTPLGKPITPKLSFFSPQPCISLCALSSSPMEWTRGPIIGRGSTATVSLATSVSSGELFAVKSTELSHSMFLQKEQSFLSKLSSPYVVKYIGFDITNENNKTMYNLCMEYVPGGTLHDVIQRHGGQLHEPMIRLYTRHILQGLHYMHTNRLVHCDIKSQNVLINKDGAKIADLGCARFVMEVASQEGGDTLATVSGTPVFMAPEVARGEEQGFPADIWAMGCTVIEMATGSNPWAELNDPVSALYKIGFSTKVPEFPGWLSEKAKDFLSKCLRRDPKERWTAKELLDHPFLDKLEMESKEIEEFNMGSPSCVLEQGFWDSLEALESPQNLTLESFLNSPADQRIKTLIGLSSVSDPPNWTCDEDWVTVRSSDIEETTNNIILVNEPSAATGLLCLDSITYEQELESSMFVDDLLFQFSVENISSDTNVGTSEGHDYVSKNLNFETDNDNSCFLQPQLFYIFCSSFF